MKSHSELYIRIVGYGVLRARRSLVELRDVKGGVGLTILRSLRDTGLGIHDVEPG